MQDRIVIAQLYGVISSWKWVGNPGCDLVQIAQLARYCWSKVWIIDGGIDYQRFIVGCGLHHTDLILCVLSSSQAGGQIVEHLVPGER